MSSNAMLTTEDNPFNPHHQFDEWRQFDERKGYHTLSLLARVTVTSSDLSEVDQELALDLAIDEIVEMNVTGNYKKVFPLDQNDQGED